MGQFYLHPTRNSFEKIKAWRLGHQYRRRLYNITREFPFDEKYKLVSQICRAAISVTSNIAEGYGRYHFQETIQYTRQSRGSVSEILDHLYTALDEGYIDKELFDELYLEGREVERAINGYITFIKSLKDKK
jgi:four helix bundle protein